MNEDMAQIMKQLDKQVSEEVASIGYSIALIFLIFIGLHPAYFASGALIPMIATLFSKHP